VHSYDDAFAAFLKSASGPMFFNLIIVGIVSEFLWELSFISFPFLIGSKHMHRIQPMDKVLAWLFESSSLWIS